MVISGLWSLFMMHIWFPNLLSEWQWKEYPSGEADQSFLCIFCHYCYHQDYIGAPVGEDWLAISPLIASIIIAQNQITLLSTLDHASTPHNLCLSINLVHSLCSSEFQVWDKTGSISVNGIQGWQTVGFSVFKISSSLSSGCCSHLRLQLCTLYTSRVETIFLKHKYMFAVFLKTLLTDVLKSFVWDHADDADAQEVYKAVVDYYLKSTKASLDAASILSYIATYITPICLAPVYGRDLPIDFVCSQSSILVWETGISSWTLFIWPEAVMLQNSVHPVILEL